MRSSRSWLRACAAVALAALSQPALGATDAKPLSDYTQQLIDLMAFWGQLNQKVADRMQQNERYLLASYLPAFFLGGVVCVLGSLSLAAIRRPVPAAVAVVR